MRKNTKIVEEWFERGDHDIESSELLFNANGYTDTICFHAHQAVEKYLKGYLLYQGDRPRKIHNLEELAKDCATFDKNFLNYLDDCLFLTRYYIETRYPTSFPYNYPREEAKKAIETANVIIKFIRNKFKNG